MQKTDAVLINRAIQGEDDAWRALVQWYLPLVYHWCRKFDFRTDVSAEISQTVFLKVSQAFSKIDDAGSISSFRGWLHTLTRNVMIDWLRKHGDEPVAQGGTTARELLLSIESDEASSSSGSRINESLLEQVDEVRNEFSENVWDAFWLTSVEGLSGVEAGEKLGMRRGAVYQAKFRVLKRLRRVLSDPR